MNKIKSFLIFTLLFSLLFCLPISKASAASASLSLTSNPTGAAVYRNGSYTYHVTPYLITGLTAGVTYALSLKKTGYVTKTASFKAVAGSTALTLTLSAMPTPPSLSLTSSPPGATVSVNGVKQASLTPCTFKNEVPGTHYALTFSKVGYVTQTVQSTATAVNASLTVVLKKILVLNVTSIPTGATVYINNVKQVSLTPCSITGYTYGTVLNFTLSKAGYLSSSQTFSTQVEGTSNISATLAIIPPPAPPAFVVIPAIQYASTTATESRAFAWTYAGTAYTWQVAAPESLLGLDRSVATYIGSFYTPPYTGISVPQNLSSIPSSLLAAMHQECYAGPVYADYVAYTQEPANAAYIGQLASTLATTAKTAGYDYFHEAEFILTFVEAAVPYTISGVPQLPVATLFAGGVCADKSILYISLLKALNYKVAFFLFMNYDASINHEQVGVAFTPTQVTSIHTPTPTPCPQNGKDYYSAECASTFYLLGDRSFNGPLIIYPVN